MWDVRDGSLLWVDIENPAVWRHWPATNETVRLPLDEKIGFALLTRDLPLHPLGQPDPHRVRLSAKEVSFDAAAIVKRSRGVSGRLNGGVGMLLKKNKVDVIWGEASIEAAAKGNEG